MHPGCTDDWSVLKETDAIFIALKAHSVGPVAHRLTASLGAGTIVISAQNGNHWWYFQRHGGQLDGIHLETVDPGGVIGRAIERVDNDLDRGAVVSNTRLQ